MTKNFAGFVELLTDLIGLLVAVVFAVTVLIFVWGVVRNVILSGGDEYSLAKGKQLMFWGVIVLAVMVGIWGILAIFQTTFFG